MEVLVNIRSAEWNLCPNRTGKADNIDQDAGYIRGICAEVDTNGIVVWTSL